MATDPHVASGVLPHPAEAGVAMAREWTESEARETPVPADYCVWCKRPIRDADGATPIGDDEIICDNCLGDLRQFKRYQRVMIVASEGFDVAARTIAETCDKFHDRLVELYGDDPAMFRVPDRVSRAGERYDLDFGDGTTTDTEDDT